MASISGGKNYVPVDERVLTQASSLTEINTATFNITYQTLVSVTGGGELKFLEGANATYPVHIRLTIDGTVIVDTKLISGLESGIKNTDVALVGDNGNGIATIIDRIIFDSSLLIEAHTTTSVGYGSKIGVRYKKFKAA